MNLTSDDNSTTLDTAVPNLTTRAPLLVSSNINESLTLTVISDGDVNTAARYTEAYTTNAATQSTVTTGATSYSTTSIVTSFLQILTTQESTSATMSDSSVMSTTTLGSPLLPRAMKEEEEEERTALGMPIKWIWVPYVSLSIIIISLILASFCKFHKKNGHKYRRRKFSLFSKFRKEEDCEIGEAPASFMNQVQHPPSHYQRNQNPRNPRLDRVYDDHQLPPNGGPNLPPPRTTRQHSSDQEPRISKTKANSTRKPPRERESRERESRDHESRERDREPRERTQERDRDRGRDKGSANPSKPATSRTKNPANKQTTNTTRTANPNRSTNPDRSTNPNRSTNANRSTNPPKKSALRKNRPVNFARNANGSMVDLRVAGNDSVKMFKTSFVSTNTMPNSSVWASSRQSKRARQYGDNYDLPSPTGIPFTEEEDGDSTRLIRQSHL